MAIDLQHNYTLLILKIQRLNIELILNLLANKLSIFCYILILLNLWQKLVFAINFLLLFTLIF